MDIENTSDQNGYLVISSRCSTRIIRPDEILFVKAIDNYSRIHLVDLTTVITCQGLCMIEKSICHSGFFRCHKSFLINLNYIQEIRKGKISYVLYKGAAPIPVARRRTLLLKKALFSNMLGTAYPAKSTIHPVAITVN